MKVKYGLINKLSVTSGVAMGISVDTSFISQSDLLSGPPCVPVLGSRNHPPELRKSRIKFHEADGY